MIAFVLSGGGSRGAFEVGALRALLANGIQPDLLVGTSAGAVNATAIALDPTLEGVERLERLWLRMDEGVFYSPNPLVVALRLMLKKPSLYSNARLYRFVRAEILPQARTFSDLKKARLFLTGVDLERGDLHVFGDTPDDSVIEAIMASTVIQPYFAPWAYRGRRYIDGGFISNLPLLAALERGASEIYAIDLTTKKLESDIEQGLFPLLRQEVNIVLDQLRQQELLRAQTQLGRKLHHIHYEKHASLMPFDFSHTTEMIADGEAMMTAYLQQLHRVGTWGQVQGWVRGRLNGVRTFQGPTPIKYRLGSRQTQA